MKRQENNIQFYSRLEVFCNCNLYLPNFKKEVCFRVKDDVGYNKDLNYSVNCVEFSDFDSTINCLYQIESAWEILRKGKEVSEDCMETGASIMIYNQSKLNLYIGMSKNKWFLSHLSKYTNEWKENYSKNIKNNSGSSVILYIPFCQDENTDEFISKERVCALLKEWLQTGKYAVDFDGNEKIAYMEKILNQ